MTTPTQNRNFTIRLDAKVKEKAESLFAELGMTLFGAMNIFLHQALIVGGLPFEVRRERPNKTTLAAMEGPSALPTIRMPSALRRLTN